MRVDLRCTNPSCGKHSRGMLLLRFTPPPVPAFVEIQCPRCHATTEYMLSSTMALTVLGR